MSNIHFKTAAGYIRRFPYQAIAAIFVLGITFFVTTIHAVLVYSSNITLKYYETRPQVIAFLKNDATQEDIATLQSQLERDSKIKEVRYVSKEEAFEIYKEGTSYNPLLSELVSPETLPASIEFSLVDLNFAEEVMEGLRNNQTVDQVGFTANLGSEEQLSLVIERLRKISYYTRVVGGSYIAFQITASLFVLLIIISMRMHIRKSEIEILDLIGANSGFIYKPILLEALFYAIAGAFVGWLFAFIIVLYATPTVLNLFSSLPVLPQNTNEFFIFFLAILGVELILSSFLAIIGSSFAVSRSRRALR